MIQCIYIAIVKTVLMTSRAQIKTTYLELAVFVFVFFLFQSLSFCSIFSTVFLLSHFVDPWAGIK